MIKSIVYNWFYTIENGEDYFEYEVGKQGVIKIEEHMPVIDNEKLYYDVYFEDGSKIRLFNVNSVKYAN